MDAEDWLYGDGEHEAAADFRRKLGELRAVGGPIERRAAELSARPEARARACVRAVPRACRALTAWWRPAARCSAADGARPHPLPPGREGGARSGRGRAAGARHLARGAALDQRDRRQGRR